MRTVEVTKQGLRSTAFAASLLLLALSPASGLAADARPMRFDRLSLDEGLSQSAVLAVHQDSKGFMWFGTENGLNRYDGYTFRHSMLKGFDPRWIELGALRRVTYTNLDHGHYTFRVRAANSDGVWNESGLSLPLTVAPAPWESWWAYALYVLAAVTLIGMTWRNQQRKLAREAKYSRRLEREVQARTGELADRNADGSSLQDQALGRR